MSVVEIAAEPETIINVRTNALDEAAP